MVFTGEALRRILLKQERSVSIFDKRGRFEGSVPPSVAVELARKGKLFGIGRANLIYDLQPDETRPKQDLELLEPSPASRPIPPVKKNHTPRGAKEWQPRPDNARSGSFGTVRTLHFRQ